MGGNLKDMGREKEDRDEWDIGIDSFFSYERN